MGNVEFDSGLSNGMHIAVLTTVADDSRTMLTSGLTSRRPTTPQARTNDLSVISALPFTLYPKDRFFANAGRRQGLGMLMRKRRAAPKFSQEARRKACAKTIRMAHEQAQACSLVHAHPPRGA
jgi:hypothetical protein